MTAFLSWFSAARWHESIGHCLVSLLILIPIGLLTVPAIGALSVLVFYWSRKKTETEDWLDQPHTTTFCDGWFPWQWGDWYMTLDVVCPTLSSALLAWGYAALGLPTLRLIGA